MCGQENTEPKQSIGHLISHFFNDVTHFDGKFFSTLGTLIRRPGLLTLEYMRGRKASYLDPVRMYLFTSAIFFLVFFKTSGHVSDTIGAGNERVDAATIENMSDSSLRAYSLQTYDSLLSRQELTRRVEQKNSLQFIIFGVKLENNLSAGMYDSVQQALPPNKRDGFFMTYAKRAAIRLNEIYKKDPKHFFGKIVNNFLHGLPQMLFISLPIFALILKLLYSRRKQFYYTDHVIFTIHLYIFTFIIILLILVLEKFDTPATVGPIDYMQRLLEFCILFYQYKAMRNFYQQRRAKTIFKFTLLNLTAVLMLFFLASGFFIFGSMTLE